MNHSIFIGSRGSKLALWQAEHVKSQLLQIDKKIDVRIEIIKTTGDVKSDPLTLIGGKGVFTKELEDALLDERIDVAVHSLKDLPTVLPDGLSIAAICEREDPRDALVLRSDSTNLVRSLVDLAEQSIVGTSSQRRFSQLKALRSDLVFKDLRGNVDTRLRKLDEGEYDALVLATAGLRRLGQHERINLMIDPAEMLSAVGQGAIALETRSEASATLNLIRQLDHLQTRIACLAERSLLRCLGGGCQFPIAAAGVIEGNEIKLDGLVAERDGSRLLRDQVTGSIDRPEEVGAELAEKLIARGAASILDGN
jgi:hydroxymethylbilane synthase